jgi:hypothetical protein
MERDENGVVGWRIYDQSFREDAHQLVAWGYWDSRTLLTASLEETEITGFISEAIQNRLNSTQTPERFERYSVKEDNPTPGEGRTGKRRMRIDIIIEAGRPIPRPKYIFEAKRLSKPNHPISTYTGEEGLMRLITDRYAADCPEAGMIGYLQTDSSSYWMTQLEEQFENDSAKQFRLTGKLSKESITPDLTDVWSSGHTRASGSPITIFHLFLACTILTN